MVSRHDLDAKLNCRVPFWLYCEVHVDPDITNTMDPKEKWAICLGPTENLQGSNKFLSLAITKKVMQRKFTEMLIYKIIIKQVEKIAVKNGATKFRNRMGFKYEFDNDKAYKMLLEPEEPPIFLDIPAKAPGMLMERKEEFGVDDMVQEEREQIDKEQAMLAAENSGLDFSSLPTKDMEREVIEILNNREEEAINKYV